MLIILYLSEAGEQAYGQFENSTHEYANQIFVDGYMKHLVVCYAN
jgi:hypothetical protein